MALKALGHGVTLFAIASGCMALPACATENVAEERQESNAKIVNGTVSGAADDAVVRLLLPGALCSATLIAPDLLLTAHHCVAQEEPAPATTTTQSLHALSFGDDDGMGPDPDPDLDPDLDPGLIGGLLPLLGGEGGPANGGPMNGGSMGGTSSGPLTGSSGTSQPTSGSSSSNPDTCGSLGPNLKPSDLQVVLGAQNADQGANRVVAVGVQIFVREPTTCGQDVALVRLDRKIPNAKIAPLRLTPVTVGESGLSTVGFGRTSTDGDRPATRMRRDGLRVDALGGQPATFRRKNGQTINYELPPNDLATGESTCNGDSGGPLFDARGQFVAVTSRGLDVDDNCGDGPAIWAGLAGHEDLIREAAQSVGLKLR
jgi:secreted trypsin-like serine protease